VVLALVGPTACGKSALAHAVARALGGELIVADPFQRYRGLEIAADAPGAAARAEVRHHAVGDLALTGASTAAGFAAVAHTAIDAVLAAGRTPVVTGGTGLYVRAALGDLGFGAEADPEIRAWADALVLGDPGEAIAELRRRDPAAADRVDAANPRRVARALEVAATTGAIPPPAEPVAALWTAETRHPTLVVGVARERAEIDRRIAVRVRRELDDGLVAELERALDTPGVTREALQVIGAREVAAMRVGALTAAELPERLAARTRRLARAQATWLRKTPGVVTLELGTGPAEDALPRLLELWRERRGDPVPSGG